MAHDETRAVAERYARRVATDVYNPLRPEVQQARQERERALARLLRAHAPRPLAELDLLEVGCGAGDNLLDLIRLGAQPARVIGNELLPARAAVARQRLPAAVRLLEGDATGMDLPAAGLDVVMQYTVFSSILDNAFQQQLAQAMWQWLRPGGGVLWYDFTVNNPRNPDVRGVPLARVQQLFPQGRVQACKLTLAPPIARAAARLHPALLPLLGSLPPLRTHVLAWVGKP